MACAVEDGVAVIETNSLQLFQGVCKPYPLHPCGKHENQTYYGECPNHTYRTPACKKYCQYGYDKRYDNDKVYVTSAYQVNSDEAAIRAEIMSRGPVQAAFTVYGDFMLYTGGIYVHTAGKLMGGHGVKIIGWGVENGTKYWTVANSWNSDWGEDGTWFQRHSYSCYLKRDIFNLLYIELQKTIL
ncbi:papain family cysteine protease, partial [Ostertagia ostertagi]